MSGYKFVRGVAGVFAKLFYRIEYHGRENEPLEGGCIAIANHSSFLDPIAVACALKRPVYFMGKSELLKFKPMEWIFKACNVVAVHRGESDIAAVRLMCQHTNEGKMTGIFPQGTRIRCDAPEKETAMAGIGLIAMRAKVPMLPIAVCYGKKHKKPTLFCKVHVYIGKPISYEEFSNINGEGVRVTSHEVSEYAFSKVCDLFAENNHG